MSSIIDPAKITPTIQSLALAYCQDGPSVAPALIDALTEAGLPIPVGLVADLIVQLECGWHYGSTHPRISEVASLTDLPALQSAWDSHQESTARAAKAKAKADREAKYVAARRATVLALGVSYHARVAGLFVSKRGEVAYGSGGQESLDWDAYGKRGKNYGGRPASWRNGGARLLGYARTGRIVLETHRGTEVARLPLPPANAVLAKHRGLLGGDLYLVPRKIAGVSVAIRFGPTKAKGSKIHTGYARTGVAVRFVVPAELLPTGVMGDKADYWEHGSTVAVCRAEHERKLTIARERLAAKQASDRLGRAARLIVRLCGRLEVTEADARSVGYCAAGIQGFANRHNLVGVATVAALRLTGDAAVESPIAAAAERVAKARFAVAVQ